MGGGKEGGGRGYSRRRQGGIKRKSLTKTAVSKHAVEHRQKLIRCRRARSSRSSRGSRSSWGGLGQVRVRRKGRARTGGRRGAGGITFGGDYVEGVSLRDTGGQELLGGRELLAFEKDGLLGRLEPAFALHLRLDILHAAGSQVILLAA